MNDSDTHSPEPNPEPAKTPTAVLKVNEQKWSSGLMAPGWTAMPTVLIERQKALGLDAIDMNIVLHLASVWWSADTKPQLSKTTIATAMGVDPRTIQRRIARLEAAKLIRREERRLPGRGSRTNIYHLDGLISAAQPFAAEKVEAIKQKIAEKKARAARKRPILPPVPPGS